MTVPENGDLGRYAKRFVNADLTSGGKYWRSLCDRDALAVRNSADPWPGCTRSPPRAIKLNRDRWTRVALPVSVCVPKKIVAPNTRSNAATSRRYSFNESRPAFEFPSLPVSCRKTAKTVDWLTSPGHESTCPIYRHVH